MASEAKRKSKSRLSLAKRFSSKLKNNNRQSKTNIANSEGSSEFASSSGSLHEVSEEIFPEAPAHQPLHESEEREEKHNEKKDRRKSKHQKKGTAHHPKKSDGKVSAKKRASATKIENGHVTDQPNAPVTAYGLDKQAEGKHVQYTVNEKGESVQFSINKKGVPELWLQVDHDQCLVSPMTINSASFAPASSSSLSTTQQSLDSNEMKRQPMSSSKQDLFMKTSLLTIGEGGKEKQNGVRPKVNSLMGQQTSESEEDSIAAEEQLLNQFDDNFKAPESKPKTKKKGTVKKKKKKEKEKKKRSEMSGDEDDRVTQPQSTSVVPEAKIPSLEERSSIKLPTNKNGKAGKKIKKKVETPPANDIKAIQEEEEQPDSPIPPQPPPPPPPAETSPESAGGGGGRRIVRRIQRINSVPASTMSSMDTSSPDPKGKGRISVASETKRSGVSAVATRTSTYESPKRMNLKDLRQRFGAQQSEIALTMSPAALAAGGYGDMPAELQAYGRPSDQRTKRPGLAKKEYKMSQRSLRNLEIESSVSDDDEDGNLVQYLKNSNYKLDL